MSAVPARNQGRKDLERTRDTPRRSRVSTPRGWVLALGVGVVVFVATFAAGFWVFSEASLLVLAIVAAGVAVSASLLTGALARRSARERETLGDERRGPSAQSAREVSTALEVPPARERAAPIDLSPIVDLLGQLESRQADVSAGTIERIEGRLRAATDGLATRLQQSDSASSTRDAFLRSSFDKLEGRLAAAHGEATSASGALSARIDAALARLDERARASGSALEAEIRQNANEIKSAAIAARRDTNALKAIDDRLSEIETLAAGLPREQVFVQPIQTELNALIALRDAYAELLACAKAIEVIAIEGREADDPRSAYRVTYAVARRMLEAFVKLEAELKRETASQTEEAYRLYSASETWELLSLVRRGR